MNSHNLVNPFSQSQMQANGQGTLSQGSGPPNIVPQGQYVHDFNPNDRNQYYRPRMGQFIPKHLNQAGIKKNPHQFKKKFKSNMKNSSNSLLHDKSTSPSTSINANPRNKGILITYKKNGEEKLKVILNKIADDLQISLASLKGFGLERKPNTQSVDIMLFFNNKDPYTKVVSKMELQENLMLEGRGCDTSPFFYDGPRDLAGPLELGDVYSSVRPSDRLFALKIGRLDSECNLKESIDLLEEWNSTRFSTQVTLLEENIHAVRLSHENVIITFRNDSLKKNFMDFLTRNIAPYMVSEESIPSVIAISQGPSRRSQRNVLKITPDMKKVFQSLSTITPQMIECFKLMATGKFQLVEIDDDTVVNNTADRLNNVQIDQQMDTEATTELQQNLPLPIQPNNNTVI